MDRIVFIVRDLRAEYLLVGLRWKKADCEPAAADGSIRYTARGCGRCETVNGIAGNARTIENGFTGAARTARNGARCRGAHGRGKCFVVWRAV